MGNTFYRQLSCLGINEDQCTAVLIYSKFLQGVSCKLYIFAPQKVNSDSRRKQNTSLNLGRKELKKKSPVPPTLGWRTDFLHMRYFAFYSLIVFFLSRQLAIGLLNQKRFCLRARVVPSLLPSRNFPNLFSLKKCWDFWFFTDWQLRKLNPPQIEYLQLQSFHFGLNLS
uniref:Uncharacterized protein n=1 Tax=Micrurus spixii TaxID=129469 RepID=A0A2D4MRK9_9SAUR